MPDLKKYFPPLSELARTCIRGGAAVSFAAALCSLLLYAAFACRRFAGLNMYLCALQLRSYSIICLAEAVALPLALNALLCRGAPRR